jgi:hypothetical protein
VAVVSSTGASVFSYQFVRVTLTVEVVTIDSDTDRAATMQRLMGEIAAALAISTVRLAELSITNTQVLPPIAPARRRILDTSSVASSSTSLISFVIKPGSSVELSSAECVERLRIAQQDDVLSLRFLGRKVSSLMVEPLALCVNGQYQEDCREVVQHEGTGETSSAEWRSSVWFVTLVCIAGVACVILLLLGVRHLQLARAHRLACAPSKVSTSSSIAVFAVEPECMAPVAQLEDVNVLPNLISV